MLETTIATVSSRFLTDKSRAKTIPLDWPVEVGGVAYHSVGIKRMTTGEVDAYLDEVRAAPEGAKPRWPIYDTAGARIPNDVWLALDPDDSDKLGEALNDFLPAKFRTAMTGSGSTPITSSNGDNTSAG